MRSDFVRLHSLRDKPARTAHEPTASNDILQAVARPSRLLKACKDALNSIISIELSTYAKPPAPEAPTIFRGIEWSPEPWT